MSIELVGFSPKVVYILCGSVAFVVEPKGTIYAIFPR